MGVQVLTGVADFYPKVQPSVFVVLGCGQQRECSAPDVWSDVAAPTCLKDLLERFFSLSQLCTISVDLAVRERSPNGGDSELLGETGNWNRGVSCLPVLIG